MIPKQSEMDEIVKLIFKAIETKDGFRSTLLVLCGDHGMNDAGNHGGSAQSETSPALVFLSPKFQTISNGTKCPTTLPEGNFQYYNVVEQSDIAPTLAGLLAFPVPLNNLGVFIPSLLPMWSDGGSYCRLSCQTWQSLLIILAEDQISLILQNARQIRNTIKETSPKFNFESNAGSECEQPEPEKVLSCMWAQVSKISKAGSHPYTKDTLHSLIKVGWSILYRQHYTDSSQFLKHAQDTMSSAASKYDIHKLYFSTGIAVLANIAALTACATWMTVANPGLLWICSLAFLYGIMMFASSYVEEEHQFWYWVVSSWCGWLFLKE